MRFLRPFVLLVIVTVAACATRQKEESDSDVSKQTKQEVVQWLAKVPHLKLWGVSKWENQEVVRAAYAFDLEAWAVEGREIPHIEQILRSMLEQSDPNVDLSRVVFALGWVGSADSVPVLLDYLDCEDGSIQVQAVWALGRLRDPQAVRPLGERLMLMVDPDIHEPMVAAFVSALEEIGDERAMKYLKRAADLGEPLAEGFKDTSPQESNH